jgi:hypothetical protein
MKKISVLACTLFCMALVSITVSSCKKAGSDEQQPATGSNGNGNGNSNLTATISGKVTSPSGTAIGHAAVMVGTNTTYTDHLGEFSLVIPCGNQTVTIQTGKGNIFKKQVPVSLSANASFRVADSSTVLTQVGQMLVIQGDYDAIEIIIFQLGYTATVLPSGGLPSANLQQYDAIFLNCTATNYMSSPYYQALDTFVMNGGSIYASDWAVEYLTGNGTLRPGGADVGQRHDHHVESTQSTCTSPLLGGFVPDSSLCTMKAGSTGLISDVTIYDAGMIGALGNDSIDILYNLANWEMVNQLDAPFVTTMARPGFPGVIAAKADMSSYYSNAGSILYTTFHNHPQSSVSGDVLILLQYFIMNL